AKAAFDRIPSREVNTVAWNALLSCYSKCGRVREAMDCFERMEGKRDVVSWNTILAALARAGQDEDARNVFAKMPEWDTSVLENIPRTHATAKLAAMVDTYAKAGAMEQAKMVFDSTRERNSILWIVLLRGYARNGLVDEASDAFRLMPLHGNAAYVVWIGALVSHGWATHAKEMYDTAPHKSV
ncbi:hypothetical protein SELMODRAFT_36327, partial [Selaginella moellendorffii]